MPSLNKAKWKLFNFNKIFNFDRGKRLTTLDQTDGDIAYISSSKKNNGIDNYISPPGYMRIYQNVLTLNNSGSVGYCFYHPYPIVCSDHCTIISIKDPFINMNSYLALFLKPIIESMRNKYSFAREISDYRLNKERIMLPIDRKGNPNWKFMGRYVKEKAKRIVFNQPIKYKKQDKKIDTTNWKWFSIKTLFDIEKGERLVETERIKGDTPLITASSKENGIVTSLSEDEFKTNKRISENKITIDMFFNVFYHNYKYFSDDNVHTLIPKFDKENPYVYLFLITLLRESSYKYAYGRQLRIKRLELEKIKLPIDEEGNPDWQFMENYVKSLPYSSNL